MLQNRENEILSEIFRLIEEQNRALESRLCDKVAVRCEERSARIRNLLEQVSGDKHSNLTKRTELSERADTRMTTPLPIGRLHDLGPRNPSLFGWFSDVGKPETR